MEEDEACLFGDVVLRCYCPKILIVSTPNYEYNVILQKSNNSQEDDDPDDEKNQQQQPCKYRNHDHKFEWTRSQFAKWASDLATRHDYIVEFSGVGSVTGVDLGVELGFASQIAVFRRKDLTVKKKNTEAGPSSHFGVIWEWNN